MEPVPRRRTQAQRLAALVGLLSACFVDSASVGSAGSTMTSGEVTTTTSASATTTSASASATTTDASASSGAPVICGDGIVGPGEACDDGAANDPYAPGACRPECALPACGDGSLYLGPLGPAQIVSAAATDRLGNDTPRAIGVAADGTLQVAFLRDGAPDMVMLQGLAADGSARGEATVVSLVADVNITDPGLAQAPGGALAIVWERPIELADVVLRRLVGMSGDADELLVSPAMAGAQDTPAVAIDGAGRVRVAYRSLLAEGMATTVELREFADLESTRGGTAWSLSDHTSGDATSPAIAATATGGSIVAWGAPTGELVFRRIAADGALGPIRVSGLRPGSGKPAPLEKEWVGVASIAADDGVAVIGIGDDGGPWIERYDGADAEIGAAPVTELASHFVMIMDLTSDPHGNLLAAWTGCGLPADPAPSCGADSRVLVRWFYADLTPVGPTSVIGSAAAGAPTAVGVVHSDAGGAAVVYGEAETIKVRVAPTLCP